MVKKEDLSPVDNPESECYGCAAEMCIGCGMKNSHNVIDSFDQESYINEFGN